MNIIKSLIRSTLLIAILWPLSVSADWTNLLPGSNITVQEVHNGAVQTTTIYCSAYVPEYDPRTTFSIQQQGGEYLAIMNGYTVDTRYFFNDAVNTLKTLMTNINPWDIRQANCSIQQLGHNYQVLIGQDVADVLYFFSNANSTLKKLRKAGICR